jgi:sugar phosphate isomerase/epimerase
MLICSTAAFFSRPLEDAFAHIAGAGFTGAEVMVTRDPDTQDSGRLQALSARHGLTIRAIHAPFLLMTRSVWGTDPVEKIRRAIELAEETGASVVVAHPPYRWQARYRRWIDHRMEQLSRDTPVRVAVENMFPVRLAGDRGLRLHPPEHVDGLDGFPHVVLDTSHAAVTGLDLFEAVGRARGRLAHVHLSNNAGRGWDSHLPVDQGILPIAPFLEHLRAVGFAGSISLELDLRRYMEDGAALKRVLASNRAFCQDRLPIPA